MGSHQNNYLFISGVNLRGLHFYYQKHIRLPDTGEQEWARGCIPKSKMPIVLTSKNDFIIIRNHCVYGKITSSMALPDNDPT